MTVLTDWRSVTLVTRKQRLRYKLHPLHNVWLWNSKCNEMSQQPLRTWSFIYQTHASGNLYSQTSVHKHLGSRTILVYEQIFRTRSVLDDVQCHALRTRKSSKRRQKQITLDNFLVRQRPSGSEAESSGAKRQKKEKESPSK